MNDIRVNALTIRAINYSEADKLLTLLTLERGRITTRLKGCKSPKSKLKFAASPLSFNEYLLVERNNKYIVTGCNPIDSFYAISQDVEKYYAANIILEMSLRFTEENSECKEWILTVINLLKLLCYSDISPLILAIKSIDDLLKIAGYGISTDQCLMCSDTNITHISLEDGGVICSRHHKSSHMRVSSELINLMRIINLDNENNLQELQVDSNIIREALNIYNLFIKYQSETNLKSIAQLLTIM